MGKSPETDGAAKVRADKLAEEGGMLLLCIESDRSPAYARMLLIDEKINLLRGTPASASLALHAKEVGDERT